MELTEYRTLVEKVDAFFDRVQARHEADLECRSGCSGCCSRHLTVSPVEAESMARGLEGLPSGARSVLAGRAEVLGDGDGPCPALDTDGRCAVYAFRPIVCRTQGLPMRIPRASALPILGYEDGAGGEARPAEELSVCPLNFTSSGVSSADPSCVLNLETIDATLALINARACQGDPEGRDRMARIRIGDVLLAAHLP